MHRLLFLLAILGSVYGKCRNGGKLFSSASKLSCDQKQFILDLHNQLREKVASGQVPTQPKAADMIELRWHDQAAKKAQKWANKCVVKHDPPGNRLLNGRKMGQNLATISYTADDYTSPNLTHLIYTWFNEVYENGYKVSDEETLDKSGNYTQMIWGKTEYIGCGIAHYKKDGLFTSYLVCNYFPMGNYIGQTPYTYDRLDCKEHHMVKSRTYDHLCALDNEVSKAC